MKIKFKGNGYDIKTVQCTAISNDRVFFTCAFLCCCKAIALTFLVFELKTVDRF